ncbi:hypothetical protein BOTBODRAFT_357949 [Botryobasidium botryosum FD-172 SS1]|uniref:Raptor N-terminal CASPase-like domain-containing protein n=1 Tax=Botryobasidium botryosum (strain FD-172 SS1) TaxID=930990 RepID=A0A067MEP6_BOTB1|nr:hypothetical protein BOTBODRAFT_357949 [Botryobasidium botryosum FD-172 SS1]
MSRNRRHDDDDDESSSEGTPHGHSRASTSSPSPSESTTDDESTSHGDNPRDSTDSFPELVPILPYWTSKRHLTCGNPTRPPVDPNAASSWRLRDKLKTFNAALINCLNISYDPPDVPKTSPCAVLECWVDPTGMPPRIASDMIGKNLQHQFEVLNPRMRCKLCQDPTVEDTRKVCLALRKVARGERVLLYYNGHGVPKPTTSGEIWVFNRDYSQYIPVSLRDIQTWLGSPCIFVWDCSAAGNIVTNFNTFAAEHDQHIHELYPDGATNNYVPLMKCIHLAACKADEILPMYPELPADLFTSCLTSPIEMALRYFVLHNQLPSNVTIDMVLQMPGDFKDRRTPLGELNWIFVAVTDTIAWTSFPRETFRTLFRQDLIVSSLFRNFLLAERIMRNYGCTPQSYPSLPATHTHPMWSSWDLAVEACINQLPGMLAQIRAAQASEPAIDTSTGPPRLSSVYNYVPTPFFNEHLTAFEVWLSKSGSALDPSGRPDTPESGGTATPTTPTARVAPPVDRPSTNGPSRKSAKNAVRKPPDELPILLQVLLSQSHRLRALILFSQFVDLGPWAVELALIIGIFPYVLKLLQAPSQELKPVLIFIWARILAVDPSCQVDLLKEKGFAFFADVLSPHDSAGLGIPNASEHRAMCAFNLAMTSRNYQEGKAACLSSHVLDSCLVRLEEEDFLMRQWSALAMALVWDAHDPAKLHALERKAQDKLSMLFQDSAPEVRASAMYALSIFLGASGSADVTINGGGGTGGHLCLDERNQFRLELAVGTGAALDGKGDGSPMVRKELVVLLSCLVREWRGWFVVAAWIYWEEDKRWASTPKGRGAIDELGEGVVGEAMREWAEQDPESDKDNRVFLSSFFTIYSVLLELSVDPYPEVAALGKTVVDYITALLVQSAFTRLPGSTIPTSTADGSDPGPARPRSRVGSLHLPFPSLTLTSTTPSPPPDSPRRAPLIRTDTMTSTMSSMSNTFSTLRRTSSFATSLKNLATGIAAQVPGSPTAANTSFNLSSFLTPPSTSRSSSPEPHRNVARYISPYSPAPFTAEVQMPMSHESMGNLLPPSSPTTSQATLPRPARPSPRRTKTSDSFASTSNGNGNGTGKGKGKANGLPERLLNGYEKFPSHLEPEFTAADVISALIAEDLERLRDRLTQYLPPQQGHAYRGHHTNGKREAHRFTSPLALGESDVQVNILPLKSRYFDWSCEYYSEPQMRQVEMEEPGSVAYNEQAWRRQQNERLISRTRQEAEHAPFSRWDKPVSSFHTEGNPLKLQLHQYETHAAFADDSNMLSVWDWSKKKRLTYFKNGNPHGTSVTALHFINEDEHGMILTGSSEGIVRIYRHYESQEDVELVTAFRALSSVTPVHRGSGLVTEWQQPSGTLLTGGDTTTIRVWDANQELSLPDIETHSQSSVTSLTSDLNLGHLFVAGFADGGLRVIDKRLSPSNAVVRSYHKHQSWVQNVHWQKNANRELLSASVDGEVRLWDIRATNSVVSWMPHHHGLAALAVHDQASVFVTSSAFTKTSWRTQTISVHTLPPLKSSVVTKMDLPSGLTSVAGHLRRPQYLPSLTSLTFHPHEMMYAYGGADGHIRIFGSDVPKNDDMLDMSDLALDGY